MADKTSIYTINGKRNCPNYDDQTVRLNYAELKETIMSVINFMGRYQIVVCAAFILNGLIYGFNHFITVFYVYTPKFYCKENNDVQNSCEAFNGTCPSGFRFDQDDHTIVTEWTLICNRRVYAPLPNTMYYVGVALGAIINGILADKFGRKRILLICLFSQGLIGLLLRGVTAFELFILLRTVQGFFIQGIQGCSIALMFEFSPLRRRYTNIILFHFAANCAAIMLTLISYEVRNWRDLQIICSIPTLIIICYIWAIPESILWLMSTNRKSEALQLCLKTAKLNGDHKMTKHMLVKFERELSVRTNLQPISDRSIHDEDSTIQMATVVDLLRTKCLRKHFLIMAVVNFSVALSYYGNMFFLNHLGGNRHVNFLVSNCIELSSYGVIFYVAKRLGTRCTEITLLYLTCTFTLAVGIVTAFVPNEAKYKTVLVICLTVIAKSLAGQSFTVKVLYNAELFPTICRGAALGLCGLVARIGSVVAPYLMLLAEFYSPILPMGIISVLTFVSATLAIFLPSTKNVNLPQTIDDAKQLWERTG